MKVVATQRGYYGSMIQEAGDEFLLKDKADFSKTWMEKVGSTEPKAKAKPTAKPVAKPKAQDDLDDL